MSPKGNKFMFRLDLAKTIQALAYLMGQRGRDQHAYMKLLKMLYVAERESLLETGHPLTGDTMVSMPHGPALSAICNLMNGSAEDALWSMHFRAIGNHELELVDDPGDDLLCRYETEKLTDIAAQFANKDRWETRDATHDLPEWSDPGKSSELIYLKDILGAEGKEGRLRAMIGDQKAHQDFLDALAG